MTTYEILENINNENQELIQFNEWSLKTNSTNSVLSSIYFQTIKYLNNSLYIWIGDSKSNLENMSCSMKTAFSEQPVNTFILFGNNESSQLSNDLALKLAKRLNKQVFVSVNVAFQVLNDADSQDLFMKTVEISLFNEIKQNPFKF